ncbi:uracil-xanthine permease family protein [Deltaproteobacteria bacterium OttesenSCG-928-M10]|nr:uracil-xanthine permease family protein [Deltaproteobacteria bacterium OttesenSCG-928-M10]
MSTEAANADITSGIIYELEDKPPFIQSALAALQHLMSMFISIGAPPTIICKALGMPDEIVIHMACIAFFVSGIGTFIQTNRFGPLGSGLLSIQATSFIFLTAFISVGFSARKANPDITHEEVVAVMTGAVILGSFVQMILSRLTHVLKVVFTPLVCGITVTMVGISLIGVGMTNFVGGPGVTAALTARDLNIDNMAFMLDTLRHLPNMPPELLDKINQETINIQSVILRTDQFASLRNIGLGSLVLLVIIFFNCVKSPVLRMCAMVIGFGVGTAVAWFMGMIDFGAATRGLAVFNLPIPFKYGVSFSSVYTGGFISVALLYVVSTMEATGDLSATSMLSKRPTSGPEFISRLKGGILCDGFASMLAGVFNSFPMAIFAQNNGVIQLTGNASRHVGKYVAVYLFILGLFPIVGAVFNIIPAAVLGGALILLFGIITATGMRIIYSEPVGRRSVLIIGISIGAGVGAALQPDFSHALPHWVQDFLHSPVATGAFMAIVSNLLIPKFDEGEAAPAH